MNRLDSLCGALLAGLGLFLGLPALAQSLAVLQAGDLRAERAADAAALARVAAGEKVNLLQMRGGWAQVQTTARGQGAAATGWLRASQLDMPAVETAAAAQVDAGRRQAGATAVTLGIRALPPRSNRHALIVGVGHYKADPARPVSDLAGVKHDVASALAMAKLLQVGPDNITVLRDEAATHEGVAQAIRELEARLQPGDRVFFYWSGHGSRYFDAQAGGCVEALVPHDLLDIGNRELADLFRPLAARADKLMVVHDACHSGGVRGASSVATRALTPGFAPKVTAGPLSCQQPSNVRSWSFGSATRALGLSHQDIVYVASSRPEELSFDNADSGGLATSALLQCLGGQARDLDGSGSVSMQEVAQCAQERIEARLKPFPNLLPQHVEVSGNRDFVPAWFAQSTPVTAALAAPAAIAPATPAAVAQPLPLATAVPTAGALAAAPVPLRTVLEQIHAQRDSKRTVSVTPVSSRLRIGQDSLGLSVSSSHDGHVYLALLGSDQKSLYLLFPNELDGRNRIRAGESLLLPRPQWQVAAGGPPGQDTLLVLVTDSPRDLRALGGPGSAKAGPFTQPLTDAAGRARLQHWLGQAVACTGAPCSDAFGSALLSLEEY